jgi:sulfur dioxygenase
VDRDLQQIRGLGLTLKYGLNTHVHADHITGTGQLKQKSGTCLSVISELAGAVADIHLKEFECVEFGSWKLYAVATPGHTEVIRNFVFVDGYDLIRLSF